MFVRNRRFPVGQADRLRDHAVRTVARLHVFPVMKRFEHQTGDDENGGAARNQCESHLGEMHGHVDPPLIGLVCDNRNYMFSSYM